jgi:phospholipid/cholesterol/gamma-HCH transport system substrate-binding protein
MSTKQQTLLGLLAIAAMAVLGFYTLFLTDVNLFGEPVQLVVEFEDANGLREGDAVLVAGLRVGRVKAMTFDARAPREKRITVLLNLDQDIPLFEDYNVLIEESTLLGGRNVSILPGQADLPQIAPDPGTPLRGNLAPNPIDSLKSFSVILDENRGSIENIFSNFSDISQDLRDGRGMLGRVLTDDELSSEFEDLVTEFTKVGKNMRELSDRLTAGEGTLGKLFTSNEMYESLTTTIDGLAKIAENLESGNGVAGKLLYDKELAEEIDRALRNFTAMSDDLRAGKGTIGKLLADGEAADNITAISDDVRAITKQIRDGQGSIGKIWASDELYQNLLSFSERIDRVTSNLEEGEGTLAKLLTDDELYREVLTSVKLLNRSLEDYREAAPVSTFTSVLFNVF